MKLIRALVRIYNFLFEIIPAIIFYRAIVQPEYKCGLLAISGTGTKGDFIPLVVIMLLALAAILLNSWYKSKWYYLIPFILFITVSCALTFGLANQAKEI